MSKFSDLIQKKHEMLKVTMKVDPAACKNGEITHFQEYVGFVLAEKEFEKTYEKLLKKYTLQNEGFFDTAKGALKAIVNNPIVNNPITRRLASDIIDPFKSSKYNPFVGQDKEGEKEQKDSYNSNKIIKQIQDKYFTTNKPVRFNFSSIGNYVLSYKQLKNLLKQDRRISQLFISTDLNKQIKVRTLENTYIPYINKEIEDFEREQKTQTKLNSNQVWADLVKYVESLFKDTRPTKDVLNKKILWTYILAKQNQTLSF
jgi:hypothetical protein